MTIDGAFSPNNFWELCKRNRQNNKCNMGSSVISINGNEVCGEELIKETYKEEFRHRLRERSIIPELKNYEQRTKMICDLYVEEAKSVSTPDYTYEELEQVTRKLKKRKASGRDRLPPEIMMNWGHRLETLSLNMLNMIKHSNEIPDQWFDVLISTIFKNKGSKKMLVNQRGIFLKIILSKLFERINMNRIDENTKNIDLCQAGSRTERSPADQTFLLRAAVDHAVYMKKPVYVVLYDYSQCFDSLWLEDSLLSLWKLGVQNDVLSLIRELNKQCNIVVKTPVGTTDEFLVHNIVQQGSVSGGILCSASTGEVQQEIKRGGTQVGTSIIQVLVYVDDIATVNENISDVHYSHGRVVWFSCKKRLSLSGGKCIVLCVNLKPSDVIPRLLIDNKPLPTKDVAVYLGDHFNKQGSNKDLIEERIKKGKACIVSAMALCSDVTMGLYAIDTLLLLYRSLFIPVTLYNSQAWTNLSQTNIQSLHRVQLKFIKRIFHAPSSTSNPLSYLECGIIPLQYEIHIRQLGFLHHVLTRSDNDPVNKTYTEQLRYPAPNWANEVHQLRTKYHIEETDPEITETSKEAWKRNVKEKVMQRALEELNEAAAKQTHAQNLPAYNKLESQEYMFSLQPKEARKIFHIRTGTINLRGVRKYAYQENNCRLCGINPETVEHVVNVCPKIERTHQIDNVYTTNCEELAEIANRCIRFDSNVEAMEQ